MKKIIPFLCVLTFVSIFIIQCDITDSDDVKTITPSPYTYSGTKNIVLTHDGNTGIYENHAVIDIQGNSSQNFDNLKINTQFVGPAIATLVPATMAGGYVLPAGSGLVIDMISEGTIIDSGLSWLEGNTSAAFSSTDDVNCNWKIGNESGYMAIRMIDGTDIYYGWVYIIVSNIDASNITVTIRDWAYHTAPGGSIAAGAK